MKKLIYFSILFLFNQILFGQTAPEISDLKFDSNSADLTWKHDGKSVDEFVVSLDGKDILKKKPTDRTVQLTNLLPNKAYKVLITTQYKAKSYPSKEVSFRTFNVAPSNFKEVSATPNTVKLSWTHPDVKKVNFSVFYTTNPNYTTGAANIIVQKQKEVTIEGLNPKTPYYFTIIVSPTVGVTSISEASKTSGSTQDPTPAIPSGLDASSTNNSITADWSLVSGANYIVELDKVNTFNGPTKVVKNANKQTNQLFNNLESNTEYFVRVLSFNPAYPKFPSAWSIIKSIKTKDIPPTKPSIKDLIFSADGKTVNLFWSNLSANTVQIEIFYGINDPKGYSKIVNVNNSGSVSLTDGILPCKTYAFQIVAINSSGQKSSLSDKKSVATTISKPGIITNKKIYLKASTENSMVFTWNAPDGIVDTYKSYISEKSDFINQTEIANLNLTAQALNLRPAKQYFFKVISQNCGGESLSEIFSASTNDPKPNVPVGLKITSSFSGVTSASWNAQAEVSAFEVNISENSDFNPIKENYTTRNNAELNYTFNGLIEDKTYFVKVRSKIDLDGKSFFSNWSPTISAKTAKQGTPINLVSSNIGENKFTVKWESTSIPTTNLSTIEAFEWQLSENNTFAVVSQSGYIPFGTTAKEKTINIGLLPNKTYFFRVRSNIYSRTSGYSTPIEIKTSSIALIQTSFTFNIIDLKWTNTITDATKTEIERKMGEGNFELVKSFTNGTTLTYADASVYPRTKYTYRVRIYKDQNSGYSNELVITTPVAPAPSDVVPTQIEFDANNNAQVRINWKSNWIGGGAIFEVYRSESANSGFVVISDKNDFGQFFDKPACGKTYYYRVVEYGKGSIPTDQSASSIALTVKCKELDKPKEPSNLDAKSVSSTQIDLTWSDNSDNENEFILERSLNGTSFANLVSLPAGTKTHPDKSLSPNTKYYYRIKAKNGSGESVFSNVANASTLAPPLVKPATPSGLLAVTISSSQINLNWSDVQNETSFEIERGLNGTTFTKIETLNANTISFQNSGLEASKKYYYRIRAVNSAGVSDYSNVANATTLAPPLVKPATPAGLMAVTISSFQINLNWGDVQNETSYEIERGLNGTTFTKIETLNANTITFQNSGLEASKKYYYRIRAVNSAGVSDYSSVANATTLSNQFMPPINLKINLELRSPNQIALVWDNQGNDASKIEVFRAIENENNWSLLTTLEKSNGILPSKLNDSKVRTIFAYLYKVRKIDGLKTSDWSNVLFATPQIVSAVTEETDIKIFPNPTSNYISGDYRNSKIYNAQGVDVTNKCILEFNKCIIENLPSGIYFIQIPNFKTSKFIKL